MNRMYDIPTPPPRTNIYQLAHDAARDALSPRQARKLARFRDARICVTGAARPIVVLDEHALRFNQA